MASLIAAAAAVAPGAAEAAGADKLLLKSQPSLPTLVVIDADVDVAFAEEESSQEEEELSCQAEEQGVKAPLLTTADSAATDLELLATEGRMDDGFCDYDAQCIMAAAQKVQRVAVSGSLMLGMTLLLLVVRWGVAQWKEAMLPGAHQCPAPGAL
jgi:hypothetical protein